MSKSQISVKNQYLFFVTVLWVAENYSWSMQIDEDKSKEKLFSPSDRIHLSPSLSLFLTLSARFISLTALSPNSIAALNLITTNQQQ